MDGEVCIAYNKMGITYVPGTDNTSTVRTVDARDGFSKTHFAREANLRVR